MPSIEFVNHACVIIDTGHERILTDPWLGGTAFDDGWSLVAETGRTINDLDFSHIWISHEHPDHFSPRDLKALAPERIAKTPLFYQRTPDGKVAAF
jgi:L-ascorbate metabolism protein UlaG (beta-lactamase superfamily)